MIRYMEEINLDLSDNIETVDLKIDDDLPSFPKTEASDGGGGDGLGSVDFGSGIELLMNDKKKEKKEEKMVIENEPLSVDDSLLGLGGDSSSSNKISIAENTKNLSSSSKVTNTWDNFKKLDKGDASFPDEERPLTKEEMLKEKFTILRKLETLERKGVQLTKKYTMESSLNEMKGEYENIVAERERKNSVKFQGKVLTALITGVEFLNNRFDPFDLKLDGWSEQLNENIDDYDEIFAELYEKYRSKTSLSPELKLLFQLSASGMMIHMSNSMFRSAIPGMDDIIRQNPDLMQHFTQAAMQSMNTNSPGLNNFINEFAPAQRATMPPPPPRPPQNQQPVFNSTPVDFQETSRVSNIVEGKKPPSTPPMRKEMSGPNGVDDLLAGLKKKKADSKQVNSIPDLADIENSIPKPKSKSKKMKNSISLEI